MNIVRRAADWKSGAAVDLVLILAVAMMFLLVHYQGWKSRELVNLDMLPYYVGAKDFLATGKILEKGEISSYNSYNPPGTFYLMIPGMLLTGDPRLQTFAGTALLLCGTLVFLYLAVSELAGRPAALAASLVFGVSRLGFIGLWPVGHPIFIVGSLYFLLLWIKRRASWAFAAALVVLAFGLYVDLAILPFLLVLPVLWLMYRPPLGWKSLLASGVFALLVWFPYLRFESGRSFVDIASLLLLRPVDTVWERSAGEPVYCYSASPGENDEPNDIYLPYVGGDEVEHRVVYPTSGWKNQAAYRICRILLNIDRNFDTDLFLLGPNRALNAGLWWIFSIAWAALGWAALRAWEPVRKSVDFGRRRPWVPLAAAAAGGLLFYIVLNPDLVATFAADKSLERNISLAVGQMREFLPWIWSAVFLGWLLAGCAPDRRRDTTILFVAFSLPWLILVLLAEPGRPERFWYLWVLQVPILVLGLRWTVEKLPRAGSWFGILAAALAVALMPVPLYAERISDGRTNGYSGKDNDQWKAVEYLAGRAASEGSLSADYWLSDSNLPYDPQCLGCRTREWFDYLLETVFGVRNAADAPAGGTWMVVDKNIGLPENVEGLAPEAVFGHYWIFRIP